MALPLPDARQLPDEALAALRLRALRGVELGFRECDLAELLGVAPGTVYPALQRRAKTEDAEALWGDEAGVVADQTRQKGYARRGEPAALEVPDPHLKVNQISAISNQGRVRFMTYTKSMDAALFLTFLDLPVRGSKRKVFLIVDRLRAHATPAVRRWVEEHSDRTELFYLPRRGPEVNPDEYLNNDLKAAVTEPGLPDDQEDLRPRVVSLMCGLFQLPGRVLDYFLHPCVLYASAD